MQYIVREAVDSTCTNNWDTPIHYKSQLRISKKTLKHSVLLNKFSHVMKTIVHAMSELEEV